MREVSHLESECSIPARDSWRRRDVAKIYKVKGASEGVMRQGSNRFETSFNSDEAERR
jgi:hypothetical protein